MRLHAWLTTPNHEIIDLTFYTTAGLVRNKFGNKMIGEGNFTGDEQWIGYCVNGDINHIEWWMRDIKYINSNWIIAEWSKSSRSSPWVFD